MEKTTKMVEEITEIRKITDEVKVKIDKEIFINNLVAIGVILYYCIVNIVYLNAKQDIVEIALKFFAMFAIIFTVGIFELAYRKDNGKIAIVGIEMLLYSIIVLYMPKIYENSSKLYCRVLMLIPIFCSIYSILKSIIIYKIKEKEYQNNLSDVKEIVKEEI